MSWTAWPGVAFARLWLEWQVALITNALTLGVSQAVLLLDLPAARAPGRTPCMRQRPTTLTLCMYTVNESRLVGWNPAPRRSVAAHRAPRGPTRVADTPAPMPLREHKRAVDRLYRRLECGLIARPPTAASPPGSTTCSPWPRPSSPGTSRPWDSTRTPAPETCRCGPQLERITTARCIVRWRGATLPFARDVVVPGTGLSLRVRRHGEHEQVLEPSFAQKAST